MTAIIGILNRQAVALAADSAVTIGNRNNSKIYNTVNKLFHLNRNYPLGIMICGNANLLDVPWETLIKMFRVEINSKNFDNVKSISEDFVDYLNENIHYFPEESQRNNYYNRINNLFIYIFNDIKKIVNEESLQKELTEVDISNIFENKILMYYNYFEMMPSYFEFDQNTLDSFIREHSEDFDYLVQQFFKEFNLNEDLKSKLIKICAYVHFKEFFDREKESGIVISGFGEKEIYPSICYISFDSIYKNKIKYRIDDTSSVSHIVGALVKPYAQADMVATFMEAVNPFLYDKMKYELNKTKDDFLKHLILREDYKSLDETARNSILSILKAHSTDVLDKYIEKIELIKKNEHTDPILDSIANLPKEELAVMAESLIYLTYLKRRFSVDPETVGGAIDVAVISKGDGFIWIKRKHYFDGNLNPQFFWNNFSKK